MHGNSTLFSSLINSCLMPFNVFPALQAYSCISCSCKVIPSAKATISKFDSSLGVGEVLQVFVDLHEVSVIFDSVLGASNSIIPL